VVIAMYRDLKQCSTWTVAVMLICAGQLLAAEPPTVKITVLSLRDYGWEPLDPVHPHEIDTVRRGSIAVDHKNRVLVGFAVRERSGLVTRDQPALSFHIVRLSPDGKTDLSLSLPTNGWRSNSLYLSDTDQIIVRANDSLQLLQSNSEPANMGKGSWKVIAPCGWRCQITQSPSRRTLLLDTWDVDPPLTVIDTTQLPTVRRCAKTSHEAHSITDKFAYSSGQTRADILNYFSGKTPRAEVHLYRWPLCEYEHLAEIPVPIRGRYTVMNDRFFIVNADTKAASDVDGDLEVISSEGRVKFRQAMVKHDHWDAFFVPIRSSERGDRIAVDILTTRGGNRTLDISSHVTARRIAVYDIEAGKELASVPVSAKHKYRFEFDLSPDGRRLAILEDDTVKVVDLEEARTGEKPTERADTVDLKDGTLRLQVPIPASKPKQ
jgi:hypothetical protein